MKTRTSLSKRIVLFVIIMAAVLTSLVLANSPPIVSNITASQRTDGSGMVDTYYTLTDADNDRCSISVLVSNDGGNTWPIIPSSGALSGALTNVSPGNRSITWNSKLDLPGVFGSSYRIKVIADDGHEIYRDDFTGSLTWTRSSSSVYIKDNEYLYIGRDDPWYTVWGDYAEKGFFIDLFSNKSVVIEMRVKLFSGGQNYRLPQQLIYFEDASYIGVTYLPDGLNRYGWGFLGWTTLNQPAVPGENYWTLIKVVLTSTGGQLHMKPDDSTRGWYSEQFSFIKSASWSHTKITKIRFEQPWDSINYVDYISIRYE